MKMLVFALIAVVLVLFGLMQNESPSAQTASTPPTDIAKFLQHPTHCNHLLGIGLEGDTPPADFSIALGLAIDANALPLKQAIGDINSRCKQRALTPELATHKTGA